MKNLRKKISNRLRGYTYEASNRIDISRSAILHNFDLLKKTTQCDLIPVLKANAYGHGLEEVATILKSRTFPYIAVDGYHEAMRIQRVSKQPILVMGSIGATNINTINHKNLAFVVYSQESLRAVCGSREKVRIHIEVNTGMNRHGFEPEDLAEILETVSAHPKVIFEGLMTHLATADEADASYMNKQYEQFKNCIDLIQLKGIRLKYIHAANSAGSSRKTPKYINAVRPGIALYGINTLTPTDTDFNSLKGLKPALTLTSAIDQIRSVMPGDSVGYNRTYRAKSKQLIATIPIGYYEGVPRSLSNKNFITHGGTLLQATGTICMNHTMFNCTDLSLDVGDRVTLISAKNDDPNSIINLRKNFNLFEYGLPTGLSETIRRRVVL